MKKRSSLASCVHPKGLSILIHSQGHDRTAKHRNSSTSLAWMGHVAIINNHMPLECVIAAALRLKAESKSC